MGHQVDLYNKWVHKIRDYDIVHEFSLIEWANWEYYKSIGVPMVLTPTAWPRDNKNFILKYKAKEKLKKLLLPNLNTLTKALHLPQQITPTTSLELERICGLYGEDLFDRMSVVPNGVEKPREANHELFSSKFNIEPDYLLFIGNISPVKNIEIALSIANTLDERIVIIGGASNNNTNYYQELKKDFSTQTWLGPIHDQNLISSAYRGAKMVIVPSKFETCSLVGLESLIHGTPLAITSQGGTKEVFQEAACYIDPKESIDVTANKISHYNPSQEEKNANKRFIEESYSWESVAKKQLEVYEKAINDSI